MFDVEVEVASARPLPAFFFRVLEVILSHDMRREIVDDISAS